MAPRIDPNDLRGRRHALGITLNAMAHGLGLRVADVTEIEDGTASDDRKNYYDSWLRVIASWPEDRRQRANDRAEDGHRFPG